MVWGRKDTFLGEKSVLLLTRNLFTLEVELPGGKTVLTRDAGNCRPWNILTDVQMRLCLLSIS